MIFSSSLLGYQTWRLAITKEKAEGEGKVSSRTAVIPFTPFKLGEMKDFFTTSSGAMKGVIFCCICHYFFLLFKSF